jgi:hypothetical protein
MTSSSSDTLFINGRIQTMDRAGTVVEAVGTRDGRITTTGSTRDVQATAQRDVRVVDLKGQTVLPGFIDGHVHPQLMIRTIGYLDCRFASTQTLAAMLAKITAYAKTITPGNWVIAAGQASNSTNFPEKRMPTRAELDAASPHAPLFYMNGPHTCVVNSQGLTRLGITKGMPHHKGAHIDLDESGEPTGVIHEAFSLFPDRQVPPADEYRYLTEEIPAFFLSRGVTSILSLSPAPDFKSIRQVASEGRRVPLRYSFGVFADPGGKALPATFDKFLMPEQANPEWFRLAGVKIWLDGDVPVRTGYVYDSYQGQCCSHGFASNTQEELDALVQRVYDAGLGMLIHCTGDRANVMALDAYEKVKRKPGPQPIMRIEHLGDFLLGPHVIERALKLGVRANVQPGWIYTLANVMIANLGADRAYKQSFQFRSMIDAGLEPGYGSDLTGFVRETENPFMHIQAAVTRRAADGSLFVPEQAISVMEALRMMTIWSARAQGEDAIKGSLEPGKFADMIVLSDDILRVAPDGIRDVRVVKTVVNGEIVHSVH